MTEYDKCYWKQVYKLTQIYNTHLDIKYALLVLNFFLIFHLFIFTFLLLSLMPSVCQPFRWIVWDHQRRYRIISNCCSFWWNHTSCTKTQSQISGRILYRQLIFDNWLIFLLKVTYSFSFYNTKHKICVWEIFHVT